MQNVEKCTMISCLSKWIITAIPVFIFIVLADFIINAVWLKDIYVQNTNLWRPEEETKKFFSWVLLYQAILALVFTALYCGVHRHSVNIPDENRKSSMKSGLSFGITIGVLLGILHSAAYFMIPIPYELAIKWFAGGFLEGVGIGIILSFGCRKKTV
ncbi:MAG: hypothetical protein K0R98_921 [Rickettsiaceae bacterium]|jgi:hypothetical protein|nr:hypothetical protein [Rickettsiaceae bacterium]